MRTTRHGHALPPFTAARTCPVSLVGLLAKLVAVVCPQAVLAHPPLPADQVGWYEIGQAILDYAPGRTFTIREVADQLEAFLANHQKRKRGKAGLLCV